MINYDSLHEGDTVTKPAKAALKLMYKDIVIDKIVIVRMS